MKPEDYEPLGQHLVAVKPIIDESCLAHGFRRASQRSIGRYPTIRIVEPEPRAESPGQVCRCFDLWMQLNQAGNRFTEYFEEVPYDLAAGAHVAFRDEALRGHRFQKSYLCFAGKPFPDVPVILRLQLEENLTVLEGWTVEFLMREQQRVPLG